MSGLFQRKSLCLTASYSAIMRRRPSTVGALLVSDFELFFRGATTSFIIFFRYMLYKKMLLVEDDPLGVELILAAFEETQLSGEIAVVNDGVEAVAYLDRTGEFETREKGDPKVVLLDLKMPRMDGLQVLEHVRKNERLRKVPIVMLSSSREERDKRRSYELGANAYVVKPVDFDQFKNTLKQIGAFWVVVNETPSVNPN